MQLSEQTLGRLASQHKTIKQYIDELPPEAIYNRISPGKYSIHETIAYLTRYHHIFMERICCILKEVNPFFELYKPDEDSVYQFTAAKTTGSLLHELYRVRHDSLYLLQRVSEEQCGRIGTHALLGKMDLSQWVEFFLLHESSQLFRIFKMAGSFWSTEFKNQDNVIYLPHLVEQVDEMAG